MITLAKILKDRGYEYQSVFHHHAEDIHFESVNELCYSLGYILKHVKRFDAEIPEARNALLGSIVPNYSITGGLTSGGNIMKRAPQYRIYFQTCEGMPHELLTRLQNDDQNRITGSLFVEACMYIGFVPGKKQNNDLIIQAIQKIFEEDEQEAFWEAYKS